MERVNLLCDTSNCGIEAKVFCLSGNLKVKSCEAHMSSLLSKAAQLYEISSYFFISNPRDAAMLEDRKSQQAKGCGNLAVLEANCETELIAALQSIEVVRNSVIRSVEGRFEEMAAAATQACIETKAQLSQLQRELEQIAFSKDSRLSPAAELVCLDLSVAPMFVRFGLADAAESISAVLSDSWTVTTADVYSTLKFLDIRQKNAAIKSALEEAALYAQKGIPDTLRYANSLIRDEESFEEDINTVLAKQLTFQRKQNEVNFKWLQRSWSIRQQCKVSNKATIEVGQQFGTALSLQHGQFGEAEQVLQYCYAIAQSSEDAASVCSAICSVYSASAQNEKLQQFSMWVLETFEAANLADEHYWTPLLYLTISVTLQNQGYQASAFLEHWRNRHLREGTPLAEMLRLLTCAIGTPNMKERKKCLQPARNIGLSRFPTSGFTALVFHYLADLNTGVKREVQYHRLAQSIWEVAAPKCVHAAYSLHYLGDLLRIGKQWSEAEECWGQELAIWEVVAPKSVSAGDNLMRLGQLLEATEQTKQAVEYYQKAAIIYTETGTESKKIEAERKVYDLNKQFC